MEMIRILLQLDPVDLVSIGCIAVLWISSIICIFWFWSFILQRNKIEISSRRHKSSIVAGLLSIIAMAIQMPLVLAVYNLSFVQLQYFPYTIILTNTLSIFCQSGAFQILTYRAYMIYYDIRWNLAMEDHKWRMHIAADEKNWFLRRRNSFGNGKKVGLLFFIHWLVWLFATIILSCISRDIARTAIAGPGVISIICDLIIFLKFPRFNDLFAVSHEIKLSLLTNTIGVSIYYVIVIILKPEWGTVQYALLAVIAIFVQFSLIIIIYVYPLKRFNYPLCPCRAMMKPKREHDDKQMLGGIGEIREMQIQRSCSENNNEVFRDIIETKHGFNLFARHLTREFCLENLLFFVETQQWLNALIKFPVYEQFVRPGDDFLLGIKLADSAPKSTIIKHKHTISKPMGILKKLSLHIERSISVEEVEESTDFPSTEEYIQCSKLFTKYISNEAHFCINISYSDRQNLYQAFGYSDKKYMFGAATFTTKSYLVASYRAATFQEKNNMTRETLLHIFDDARTSIYHLLMQSLGRFKTTHEYLKLQNRHESQQTI